VHEPLRLSIALRSDELSRDHGVLQVFDGDPQLGAEMVAVKTVQGLAGDGATTEQIEWRPKSPGARVLYVRHLGSGAPRSLLIPVRVEP
jgi:hypothetical protein